MPFPTIITLEQLQYNLSMGPGYDGYIELIKAVEFLPSELKKLCVWHPDHHARVCLYNTTGLEAILNCWEPGQKTSIHNYNFNHAWVKILQGELWLELFSTYRLPPEKSSEVCLRQNKVLYLDDNLGYHRFSNRSQERAVALVFYSDKPLEWVSFDEEKQSFEMEASYYDKDMDPQQSITLS